MFKVITKGCEPKRPTKYSAGIDIFSAEDVVIGAGETVMFGLGIAIDFEKYFNNYATLNLYNKSEFQQGRFKHNFLKSHYLQLMLRRSLGRKGLILPNGIGVIALDYLDELKMIIHNPIMYIEKDEYHIALDLYGAVNKYKSKYSRYARDYKIKKGDKVGQITLMEHKGYLMGHESDVERTGGIGSTGN